MVNSTNAHTENRSKNELVVGTAMGCVTSATTFTGNSPDGGASVEAWRAADQNSGNSWTNSNWDLSENSDIVL